MSDIVLKEQAKILSGVVVLKTEEIKQLKKEKADALNRLTEKIYDYEKLEKENKRLIEVLNEIKYNLLDGNIEGLIEKIEKALKDT